MMFKIDLCKYSSHPTTSASKPSIKKCVSTIQNVRPWQDLNLHLMPDGTRTRNIQIRGLMHYPLCDELLYQLSYMAGESSLAEESNTHTTLQHAVEMFLSVKHTHTHTWAGVTSSKNVNFHEQICLESSQKYKIRETTIWSIWSIWRRKKNYEKWKSFQKWLPPP